MKKEKNNKTKEEEDISPNSIEPEFLLIRQIQWARILHHAR